MRGEEEPVLASLEGAARRAGQFVVTGVTTVARRTDRMEAAVEERERWLGAAEGGALVAVPGRGWRVGGRGVSLGVGSNPGMATLGSWEDGGARRRYRGSGTGREWEAEDGVKVNREGRLELRWRRVVKEEGVTWVAETTVIATRV